MEAKDGSVGFDQAGKYDKIVTNKFIEYIVADGRKSTIGFMRDGNDTRLNETFNLEITTPVDMQKDFCQAVLNNFKKYAESKKNI